MGLVRGRGEVRERVPYARGTVDVAVREHSLGRGQKRRWAGYGSAGRETGASDSNMRVPRLTTKQRIRPRSSFEGVRKDTPLGMDERERAVNARGRARQRHGEAEH
jgi:hypothetical protein